LDLSFLFGAKGDDGPQVLWEDGDRVVWRAWRPDADGNHSAVLAVLAATEHPPPASLARLAHEYGLRDELDSAWAVRPLELRRERGRTILVLEDPGGEPLERLLGDPMAVGTFLPLAVGIAAAVGKLHARGLVHKDVKPANIVVNGTTGEVKLTGFGIASRLSRERQPPSPPESIAGTLAYMAPEQTGRMNRSIDARSDLYALGVTLYQMLTGSLPFNASDAMEWVHCHIARQPVPPSELVTTPPQLSAIVMKLLAKTAEERYQTAAGVEADLWRCLAALESFGRIDPFPLGTQDVSDRLMIPERLYGRAREIDTLVATFDRVVAQGMTELVLVSGYSGIGKSSVVNELHKVLVPPRGLFAAGKFDQYKRDIPYTTLAQALRTLVRQILVKSKAEVNQWRCALKEAVEPNGRIIVSLVPELEVIIGKQPPLPDLPPRDAHNRFQLVFRRFLGAFARPDHPLALFLDDLQWLDTATLDLLEHLVTHSEVRHLLLVGAYRDNEVSPSHPLLRMLEAVRNAGARVQEIVLAPLGLDEVGHLVADALHCAPEHVQPLAQLVQEKTGGNPFFAIQFFLTLAEEGMLAFDPITQTWHWDVGRLRAKCFTDNVVDLMVEKLKRFSSTTQEALKKLACLGNVVDTATLALVHGTTERELHADLSEAISSGLVFCQESAYGFLHDRVQQAAYSLIPDDQRADLHLRIGRLLLASMTADGLAEHLFDVANQFNRGVSRLIDPDDKVHVATIDLRAGRKAKASAAYASAGKYFATGIALLDERDWESQHELTFSLSLERAECELLCGGLKKAAQQIVELLQRAASNVEFADASCLKVNLHVLTGEHPLAIDSALACLRRLGIDLPAHPTLEQVRAEYEMVRQTLGRQPIERLIDLPPMTDPTIPAAMQVLSVLAGPATFTDFRLFCLLACRMVNISIHHGMSGASAYAYACLGSVVGANFHRYREGYRLARLACDLVEKHGFTSYDTKVYHAMGLAAFWTEPITSVIELRRASTRTATERGDLTFACYGMHQTITYLLMRSDPLDAVWRESEMALDFARTAKFRDVVDLILSQQRFIASMQGRDATSSTFSGERFDEAAFEAQLTATRTPTVICLYWIFKLKARYLSGDYAEAQAAADKAKALIGTSAVQLQLLDYLYYGALAMAAVFETASATRQSEWRELLTLHCEQLGEWAESNPPTFSDKHALVSAEVARLEGRDAAAMRLYEQAIQSAREHGFVQNEGVAHELAADYYFAHASVTAGRAHLKEARNCFARWGADGKVRQLDRLHPHLAAAEGKRPTATIGSPAQQLDVASVVKASQALSSEIVLSKLIERLMTIALENAGADRGLLILPAEDDHLIQAEAQATSDQIEVLLCQRSVTSITCPESLVRYVIRTHESVILDDATRSNLFSEDEHLRDRQTKSILCLPLMKQGRLTGLLYLENRQTSHAFTPDRIVVLELLAAQAAISLENTRLYGDLREREAKVRRLVDSNIIGIYLWEIEGRIIEANDTFLRMVGYDREDLVSGRIRWTELTPPEWRDSNARTVAELKMIGTVPPFEKEYFRADGSRVPVLIGSVMFEESETEGVAFVLDLTDRRRAEAEARESERRYREVQTGVAHANRVATLGQFTASIAHEVSQPIAAAVTNAQAALRWLGARPPDLEEVRQTLGRIVKDANRAGDVIGRIRELIKKAPPRKDWVDINEVIREVIELTGGEAEKNGTSTQTALMEGLPHIEGDRVQLQQVVLNLIVNAVQAMGAVAEGPRELFITTAEAEPNSVLVAVKDTGPGLAPDSLQHVFAPFYTTKPDGLGMGLSICRSIIEAHGGQLWVTANAPCGSIFHFTVPGHPCSAGRPATQPSSSDAIPQLRIPTKAATYSNLTAATIPI
jgi:PAS domain S-box-containing protein